MLPRFARDGDWYEKAREYFIKSFDKAKFYTARDVIVLTGTDGMGGDSPKRTYHMTASFSEDGDGIYVVNMDMITVAHIVYQKPERLTEELLGKALLMDARAYISEFYVGSSDSRFPHFSKSLADVAKDYSYYNQYLFGFTFTSPSQQQQYRGISNSGEGLLRFTEAIESSIEKCKTEYDSIVSMATAYSTSDGKLDYI